MIKIRRINVSPANSGQFNGLKRFAKEIQRILKSHKITPVMWGSADYFAYVRDKNMKINDIDFLIPDRYIRKAMRLLDKNKINHEHVPSWHSVIITKGNLKVELDPIEWYHKNRGDIVYFDFGGLKVRAVGLDSLIKMYRKASEVSEDKPKQYLKRYKELINLNKKVKNKLFLA